MALSNNYLEINRTLWNNKVDAHMASSFYDNERFIEGKNSLNEIELELLGSVKGLKVLHLQCHFGQDTISLSRLGADATGVDLSDKAIFEAKELAIKTRQSSQFICSDIYDLPSHLNEKYDIVFTSYGTIGWLPDMNKWAAVVNHFLKPNGRFIFVEFHPVVWMFNDAFDAIGYDYFNSAAIIEEEKGTYADRDADLNQKYVSWNHPISEVINSLTKEQLVIQRMLEYDYSPYNCFQNMTEFSPGKFRIAHIENKIPMVYAIEAKKK